MLNECSKSYVWYKRHIVNTLLLVKVNSSALMPNFVTMFNHSSFNFRIKLLLLLTSMIGVSSCNLFRYGIEERKREEAARETNKAEHLGKVEYNKKAAMILKTAKQYQGVPYKLGGESKDGIDCSALVMLSYKNIGVKLPRTSLEQSKLGKTIEIREAMPGDLIFFKFKKSSTNNPVNHVGIVSRIETGTLYFYHASTSLGVTESSLAEKYYSDFFVKLIRVL